MTNLIINKDGTLYTLPDSVSCGTVNGVDIKEIEVNNNGSLVTVWKLQTDLTVTVYAKYTGDDHDVYCTYWINYNNEYYPIKNVNCFKVIQIFQEYDGAIYALHAGSTTARPTIKYPEMLFNNGVCGFMDSASPTRSYIYTPADSSNNKFFDNSMTVFSMFSLKGADLVQTSTLAEIKATLPNSNKRYDLGTFTITPEQFKQATGVNP